MNPLYGRIDAAEMTNLHTTRLFVIANTGFDFEILHTFAAVLFGSNSNVESIPLDEKLFVDP
jgi:hypothetical protein